MALDDHRPHYADPQLWLRLGPIVHKRYEELGQDVLHHIKPHEGYLRQMGELAGLRWVLEAARELNRGEDG